METLRFKPHVLIIGSGLGGTALAQALRKKGIPYALFERDGSEAARFQGWAISLHPWFIKDIISATPNDLPELETVAIANEFHITGELAMFDATNMTERMRIGNGHGPDFIRADRAKLREWLLTNINVHWGKRFTHYEQDHDGVTAYFDDGSSYSGSVLVGADGINSRVRSQLLPDPSLRPKNLPVGIIVGELNANEDQLKRWRKLANSFFIGYAGLRRMFVGLKSVAPDGKSAKYYWIFGWTDKQAEADDFWTMSASKADLHSFIMSSLDGVHADFAEPFHATQVDGILHPPIQMRDMTPVELPRGRISLLGDAIHPMVPFRGEGGNMAMKDGIMLANCIANEDGSSIEDRLKHYEAEMIPRTRKSVLASRTAGDPTQQS